MDWNRARLVALILLSGFELMAVAAFVKSTRLLRLPEDLGQLAGNLFLLALVSLAMCLMARDIWNAMRGNKPPSD